MENKTKKIIAGVGMGLMLASGSLLATGCTDINLSQAQTDKILQVVDNCDNFMENTMNILEEQNKQIDVKQASKLYEMAVAKLELNYNDIWSSLKISNIVTRGDKDNGYDEKEVFITFVKGNGYGLIRNMVDANNDGTYDTDIILDYETLNQFAGTTDEVQNSDAKTFDCKANKEISTMLNITTFNEDNILSCEKLDNGGYKLLAVAEVGGNKIISECVINKDGLLLSKDYYAIERMSPDENEKTTLHSSIVIEYGVVTLEDFVK